MTQTQTIPTVTDESFPAAVLESDLPVLVDFTAAWCPPCRVMKPVLAELAAERADLRVVQLDVDAHQQQRRSTPCSRCRRSSCSAAGRRSAGWSAPGPKRRLEGRLAELLGYLNSSRRLRQRRH